jgi:hypothetical protein
VLDVEVERLDSLLSLYAWSGVVLHSYILMHILEAPFVDSSYFAPILTLFGAREFLMLRSESCCSSCWHAV